jgi:mannose-6-phosphate isomerase-like protein (cupin superfamily)
MSEPTLVPPGGGEVIGDSPDRRVEILSDDDSVHATWSRFAPGRDGADLHVHRRHTDIFYVLAGELTVRLGVQDERVTVPAGRFAIVPPLVVHGFRNGGDAELRYLNFHAPGVGFADYMRGLRDGRKVIYDQEDPPADGRRPIEEATVNDRVDIDAITIAEATGSSDTDGPRFYYALDGELLLTADGHELRGAPGAWIQAAGTHTVAGGRYLVVSSSPRA